MHSNHYSSCACAADHGPEPFAADLRQAACRSESFRTALWTGQHLQLTLMCIPAGGEIGLEMHADTDQLIRVESGSAMVQMGPCPEKPDFRQCLGPDCAVFIPAGTWHNIISTGSCPLKICSVYAPPRHPRGTVHQTKAVADDAGD